MWSQSQNLARLIKLYSSSGKAGKKEAVAHIQALGLGTSAHMCLCAHKREYMPGEENDLAVACAGLVSAHTCKQPGANHNPVVKNYMV